MVMKNAPENEFISGIIGPSKFMDETDKDIDMINTIEK